MGYVYVLFTLTAEPSAVKKATRMASQNHHYRCKPHCLERNPYSVLMSAGAIFYSFGQLGNYVFI